MTFPTSEGWEQVGKDEVVVKDWALNALCAYAASMTALVILPSMIIHN
jgi:hypothetical protein